MAFDRNTVVRRAAGLHDAEFEDEIVVLGIDEGVYYGLRDTSLDIWRRDAVGGAVLGAGPVSSVVTVRLLAANGAQSVIDPERYRLEGSRDRPRLVFEAGLPATLRAAGGIEIEYDAGYAEDAGDLPVALRLAVLHVIAALYEARQGEAQIPDAARAMMRPFAPVRL